MRRAPLTLVARTPATADSVVAVGGSAGGLEAMRTLLSALRADFPAALLLVQHRARASEALAEVLQESSQLPVAEAEDKDPLLPGRVYVAPADYHLLVERGHLALSTEEPVLFSRPSIDVLFETLADAYGPAAMGVVLTGANRDGAAGLRRIVERGGAALVQDPRTAESPTMPAAAIAAVVRAPVLPLEEIGPALEAWARRRHAACAGDTA